MSALTDLADSIAEIIRSRQRKQLRWTAENDPYSGVSAAEHAASVRESIARGDGFFVAVPTYDPAEPLVDGKPMDPERLRAELIDIGTLGTLLMLRVKWIPDVDDREYLVPVDVGYPDHFDPQIAEVNVGYELLDTFFDPWGEWKQRATALSGDAFVVTETQR